MRFWFSLLHPSLIKQSVYMLQTVEYEPNKFLEWLGRLGAKNLSIMSTSRRRKLVPTKRAMLLMAAGYAVGWMPFLTYLLITDFSGGSFSSAKALALALLLLANPIFGLAGILAAVAAGSALIAKPDLKKVIAESRQIFINHPGIKIAVAGSYGKTTMKEILATVLGEKFDLKTTQGNQNTAYSHGRFAKTLTGQEEVLIFELGEGEPGDVEQFANTIRPQYGIITGLAPNHLDKYGSVQNLGADMLSLKNFVSSDKLFFTAESTLLKSFLRDDEMTYGEGKVGNWQIGNVHSSLEGVSFELKQGKKKHLFSSRLLGRHQVAPLAMAAYLGLELGMKPQEVKAGISKTVPFEHRMQPYSLGGAWVIDDTYNGNIEGMRAGVNLLKELPAKRKWFVTPGLVDQGAQTESVHWELAQLIDQAKPDILVLMDNSATSVIREALEAMNYKREVRIETDPLTFYTNLEHILVNGDLVLMQNDWTDNYF